jgi:hypothetical protein
MNAIFDLSCVSLLRNHRCTSIRPLALAALELELDIIDSIRWAILARALLLGD